MTRNRLTKIEFVDGASVEGSLTYALDDAGNISTLTDEDGVYWSYEYDGRYRLTMARRSNDDDQTQARFGYAYDASDNLLTKELPFLDEFEDGTLTDWCTEFLGTYDISSGYLTKTSAGDGARWPRGWLDCLWHHPHRVIGLVMAGRAVAFALRAGREVGLGQGR